MAKLPAFMFYPGDWMKDPALRACSLTARGLWIDALSLMFESSRRGYLQHATGKPVTTEQLARMTGCSPDEVSRLLQELEDAGVFSRTDSGVILSRRMVRDERKREKCREAGKRGGNPNLTLKGDPKGGVNGRSNRIPTPSSSVSPSGNKEDPSGSSLAGEDLATARPRNWLFDAVAEVSGLDPKTAGSAIGTASAKLAKGQPPYAPEEVREFGQRFWELCPWAEKDNRTRPTPHEIAKNIGLLRSGPGSPTATPKKPGGFETQDQRNMRLIRDANQTNGVPDEQPRAALG